MLSELTKALLESAWAISHCLAFLVRVRVAPLGPPRLQALARYHPCPSRCSQELSSEGNKSGREERDRKWDWERNRESSPLIPLSLAYTLG